MDEAIRAAAISPLRQRSALRGFVPRRLSYASWRQKLSTEAEWCSRVIDLDLQTPLEPRHWQTDLGARLHRGEIARVYFGFNPSRPPT